MDNLKELQDLVNTNFDKVEGALGSKAWLLEVSLLFALTVVMSFVVSFICHKLYRKSHKARWRRVLIKSLKKPLQVFIWIMGVSLIGEIVQSTFTATSDASLEILVKLREMGIAVTVAWFFSRFIRFGEEHVIKPEHERKDRGMDRSTIKAVGRILRITVYIIVGLMILQIAGVSVSGILAFGGIGGIAVGFAAKDLLANFFGGLMIYLEKPFRVGDWVRSPDHEIEGTVEEIGWRLTRIRTFDKRPIYVPNALFTTIVVENPSRMQHRRIKTNIGVRYCDWKRIEKITQDIRLMLEEHPEVESDMQPATANFFEFGASSLNIMIYAFTKCIDRIEFQKVQQDIFLKALQIIEDHGAECAFPTHTVYMAEDEPAPVKQ